MIIPIDDRYRLKSDVNQWMIQRYRSASKRREATWESFKYFHDPSSAVTELVQMLVRESDVATLVDALEEVIEQAKADGHKAQRMFKYASSAEAVHAKIYKMALEAIQTGEDFAEEFYLCPVCGHIELGAPPDSCPTGIWTQNEQNFQSSRRGNGSKRLFTSALSKLELGLGGWGRTTRNEW